MPLMWRGTDHFKNKGDYRRFAVFCLARIGTEIFDTTLVCPVDRSMTDITFPDSLIL
jgi:rhotekin